MTDQVERFKALEKKRQELQTKKNLLEGQYNAKKEALAVVVEEIRKAGYDPKTLRATIADMEAKLKEDVDAFEAALDTASKKLSSIEQ